MNAIVKRSAGVLLPAFSPRREGDLGIGDTRAMSEWMHWAAAHKVGFLQLLPINETGSDDSPYNAISSVALEPLYLTMEDVPGLRAEELDTARAKLGSEVIGDRLVHYATVRTMKRTLLEIAYAHFPQAASIAEKQEFENFQREEAAWLQDYTLFRWLMDCARGSEAWDL
jgi:4-alpha-glucanotransferase